MAAEVITANPDALLEQLARMIEIRTNQAVQLVRNDVVRSLNRSQPVRRTKSGRLIGLSPSAEGEAPKRLSGLLLQTIVAKTERDGDRIVGFVGSPRAYARRLEFGFVGVDRAGRRISQGPRPFLRPALERNRSRILQLLERNRSNLLQLLAAARR